MGHRTAMCAWLVLPPPPKNSAARAKRAMSGVEFVTALGSFSLFDGHWRALANAVWQHPGRKSSQTAQKTTNKMLQTELTI